MQFGCRDQEQHNTFVMPKPSHMCVKRVWCSEGHMEKAENGNKMETGNGNRKLKTKMENTTS